MSSPVGVFPVLLDGQSTLTDVDRIVQHLRVKVRVCVRACVCVCVCVCPVLAEAEIVVHKCDRSAANRSGMRKVENLVFAWLQVYSNL